MPRRKTRRLVIVFREKDEWILDEFEKLVERKKDMRIKTSANFEAARLLKFALLGGGNI